MENAESKSVNQEEAAIINSNNSSNPVNQDEAPIINSNNSSISTDNNDERGGGGDGGNRRTPFADLSQVDADLALARTLQEQERAYMMIRMNGGEQGDYDGGWIDGSYVHDDFHDYSQEEDEDEEEEEEEEEDDEEEDAFDINDNGSQDFEIDPSAYPSDEAYARALQEAEERQMATRLLAMTGINRMDIGESEDEEDHGDNAQDAWEEVDPDELSYEELIALGEVIGTESRGLSANIIASLPSINYKSQGTQDGNVDSCVICRFDYEEDEVLTELKCKHSYHSDCINHWLQINKVCPVCSAEVSTASDS